MARVMNDRQRVELMLFPLLFKSVLETAAKRDAGYEACRQALDTAMIEATNGLLDCKRAAIGRRAVRVHDAITEPDRKGGVRADKIALCGFYLVNTILDSGYLELEEGSPLAVAINAIVEAFGEAFAETALDASAQKHARKMLARLRSYGYFEGVEFERRVA